MLHVELSNIDDVYNCSKPTIISAINLLNTNLSFNGQSQSHPCHKRNLLPFLRDALRWLMGTATMKDVSSIKARINQLIVTQSSHQETLLHIISILNVTQYAAHVNRHSIKVLMDKVDETSHDISNLYNLTTSLAISISFHQLIHQLQTFIIHLTISEWFLHISWTILMQPHQEHYL